MTSKQIITGVAVVVALAVVAIFFIFVNPFAMQQDAQPGLPGDTTIGTNTGAAGNLIVQDETIGTGAVVTAGDMVSVNYTGKLQDGTTFDTSVGKAPFEFTVGAGNVIPGWEQGLIGMKVGGKRLLIIPPQLAYGPSGYGPIPGNATLVFEIELLKVTPKAQ